jgi:hypothetical protein
MKIVPTLLLAAVLAGPVHAQVCSGGEGGGIDATGNQCNTPENIAASATELGLAAPAQSDKMGGVHASVSAAPAPIHSAKMSAEPSMPTVVATRASRVTRTAAQPNAHGKTARIEHWSEAPCAGGAYGGMDVNGDECGQAPAAERVNLVAQHKVH